MIRSAAILTAVAAAFFLPFFADSTSADEALPVIRYAENFDSVTAPSLPAGWNVSTTGTGVNWATVTVGPDTAPNAVFAPTLATTGASSITSPAVPITGGTAILRFRHRYAMETTWDGGVLDISVGGGPFRDILDAGGTFLAGGYTHDLNASTNPVGGRRAWSGATPGAYISSAVRLPASAFGQSVRLRWTAGSNDSFSAEGWWIDSVTIETVPTAENTSAVTIPASGPAAPYPSAIQVANLTGFVTGLSVNLENFSHSSPDDVDILLVAPNGRSVVLMSDAGGSNGAADVDLTFSDSAPSAVPDSAPLSSGLYRTADYEPGEAFPAPAPAAGPAGQSLGALYGVNPNGEWRLFVVDDSGGGAGQISAGWSLDIQSSVSACVFTLTPTAQAFGAAGGNGSFGISIPAGCGWTVSTTSQFVGITSATTGENSAAVTFSVAPNTGGARTALITVSDGITSRTFQVQQSSGCPTSVTQSAVTAGAGGGPFSITVAGAGNCTWNATTQASWIQITSGAQTGNGTASFTVAANGSRTARSATVSVGARTVTVSQAGASTARLDFDGDGRADTAVYRGGTWFINRSQAGFSATQFGIASDRLVPADYDSDGKTDIAVYRDGVWYVLKSGDSSVAIFQFGLAADQPAAADFDGDGAAEAAVFRSGVWYHRNLWTGAVTVSQFGIAGDTPVPADYDGDGRTDLAVYRSGTWFVDRSSLGFITVRFGTETDQPVPGDYDGDGNADPAVFRSGQWHVLSGFQTYGVTQFGIAADVPVPADFDGDGRTDPAVFRNGTWYLLRSAQGVLVTQFGLAADVPVR